MSIPNLQREGTTTAHTKTRQGRLLTAVIPQRQKHRVRIIAYSICAFVFFYACILLGSQAYGIFFPKKISEYIPQQTKEHLSDNMVVVADYATSVTDVRAIAQLYEDLKKEEALPIAQVDTYEVPNAIGTVIFFPQLHISPGTRPEDATNDMAQRVQEETYHILLESIDATSADTMMVEGALQGTLPEEKRRNIRILLESYNTLRDGYIRLLESPPHDLHADQIQSLRSTLQDRLTLLARYIHLLGAPYQLWAEQSTLKLLGTENAATQEESKTIVRERLYLEDQLARLTHLEGSLSLSGHIVFSPDMIQSVLSHSAPDKAVEDDPTLSDDTAQWVGELKRAIEEADGAYRAMTTNADVGEAPSRNDNPFFSITDREVLGDRLAQNTDRLNHTIVETRNAETAQAIADVFASKSTSGPVVLQFGAAHTEGLVAALRAQHISTVVVVPKTVASAQ